MAEIFFILWEINIVAAVLFIVSIVIAVFEDFRSVMEYDAEDWIEPQELRQTWIEWATMCLE